MPRGRRAPRRAPGRARCRRPRRCGADPSRGRRWPRRPGRRAVARRRRACGRRSRCRSSARLAAAVQVERERMSVSLVWRWMSADRVMRGAPSTRRGREALGPREGGAERRQAREPPRPTTIPGPSCGGRWPPTALTGKRAARPWGVRGWTRRCSRRTRFAPSRPMKRHPAPGPCPSAPRAPRPPARGAPARSRRRGGPLRGRRSRTTSEWSRRDASAVPWRAGRSPLDGVEKCRAPAR